MSNGIPIKLLHEATNFVVEIHLNTGDSYRGTLKYVEDNMNCWLTNVVHTQKDGQQIKFDKTYVRGSNILYFDLPEMLLNARLFKTGETEVKKKYSGKLRRTFMTVKVRKQSK
ncbi:Sm protein [Trichomonas vaginalis G3]|uniref:Small nuclear ribonucleoprotein Sm D3 n=1 Tax=Trichomonas vaginalis (strain ATCC PRA-98 / G3) TaxID=412133 RepID=A2E8V8_TRIV3|nr:U7 snRNA binding [Trichomonas vaginalis G3]EAY10940.1 Sm protein [Trichomonas vaginalis G3]KAI5485521.1 U7 snRNA binding [Trichomonas vaginalis G3]|eukprot:XP_001323163.1 Sm protein [Trichomonas vaginalis G3]